MGADGFALPANQWGPGVQGAEQKVSGLCPEAAGRSSLPVSSSGCHSEEGGLIGIGLPRMRVPLLLGLFQASRISVLSFFVCPFKDVQMERGPWCWVLRPSQRKECLAAVPPIKEHLLNR